MGNSAVPNWIRYDNPQIARPGFPSQVVNVIIHDNGRPLRVIRGCPTWKSRTPLAHCKWKQTSVCKIQKPTRLIGRQRIVTHSAMSWKESTVRDFHYVGRREGQFS